MKQQKYNYVTQTLHLPKPLNANKNMVNPITEVTMIIIIFIVRWIICLQQNQGEGVQHRSPIKSPEASSSVPYFSTSQERRLKMK
jgi:hypothetical protein